MVSLANYTKGKGLNEFVLVAITPFLTGVGLIDPRVFDRAWQSNKEFEQECKTFPLMPRVPLSTVQWKERGSLALSRGVQR